MGDLQLALLGHGTVGAEVARLLSIHRNEYQARLGRRIQLKWILVQDKRKHPKTAFPGATITEDLQSILDDPSVEIAVEVMGPLEASSRAVTRCLESGKQVVTANKALLADQGRDLFATAERYERTIAFEASVGGGIPLIAAVGDSLASNKIVGVSGILNGTTNYILSAMHRDGVEFAPALKTAQAKGFAEADASLDVHGTDAAQKLAIVARLAFGTWVDYRDIPRTGIDNLSANEIDDAKELGYTIKLLAQGRSDGKQFELRVAPTLLPKTHPLAHVSEEYNALQITGDSAGDVFLSGKGAGGPATASAVVADILGVASGRLSRSFAHFGLDGDREDAPAYSRDAFSPSRFYLRFAIRDEPGVLAQIAGVLGRHGISISSVIQHEVPDGASASDGVPLVIMTHHALERAVRSALQEADGLPVVSRPTVCLHVSD
jgi:homoserine dehydrogenase